MLDEQGVQTVYSNNTFIISMDEYMEIRLSLENMIITDQFLMDAKENSTLVFSELSLRNIIIDLKDQNFFQISNINSFVIRSSLLDNVKILTTFFHVTNIASFQFYKGQIVNSQLQQGFGYFNKLQNFQIHESFVDIITIQNLDQTFCLLSDVSNFRIQNCTFGQPQTNFQKEEQNQQNNLDREIFSEKEVKEEQQNTNSNTSEKYLNFIQISGSKDREYQQSYLVYIHADFKNLNMRFLLNSNEFLGYVVISNSTFSNMKSLDSGGCFSNLQRTYLEFTSTLFDSCQSGMFGGAIYSATLKVTDQLIIQNSKSKIGGGAFLGATHCQTENIDKVIFINNKATISSQQYFICSRQPVDLKQQFCNLFEVDSIYLLNTDLINTGFYLFEQPLIIQKDMHGINTYHGKLYSNNIYLLRLRVEYQCPENDLCIVRDFDESQSIGNLYNYLDQQKQNYYNFNLPNINFPYLLTSLYDSNNCQKYYINLFRLMFFNEGCTLNFRNGCYYEQNVCKNGMENKFNVQQQQFFCKYCGFGSYSNEPNNSCVICETEKFDKCYANISFLKYNLWRPQNSQFNETYLCQLNQKSCNGYNRQGYGNELCSEGYIGAQCLSCDINGEFWNGESYGQQGYFQCVKCKSLQKNSLLVYLSAFSVLFIFTFTVVTSYFRMRKQIFRRYLSLYMKQIYIGSSFIRQSQASVYLKILIFNLQMYLLTYYFVDFDNYDSSIHSSIYSVFNPLQDQSGMSYDCFLKNYFPQAESLGYIKLLISVISPLAINGLFFIIICIYGFVKKKKYFFLLISSFTYSTAFLFQSSIIQYCIESLICIQLTQSDQYLMIETQINCTNQQLTNSMKIISIPALIIYILALPIVLFSYIYSNRNQLQKSKNLIVFGFMYDEYKRDYYYWQFIKLFLTAFLSFLVSFGKTHIVISCLIYCAVLSIYSVSIIYCKPFQQVFINKVELISIILSVLYFLSSICLQLEFSQSNQYDSYKLGRIMSETFYYLVLSCQFIFYFYIISLIAASVFYISAQKLFRYRIFQKLLGLFPCLKLQVYTKRLEFNMQRFRAVVKNILIDQSLKLTLEASENGYLLQNMKIK